MVMPLLIQFTSIPAEHAGTWVFYYVRLLINYMHIYTGGPKVTRVTSSQNWSWKIQ